MSKKRLTKPAIEELLDQMFLNRLADSDIRSELVPEGGKQSMLKLGNGLKQNS